MVAKSQTHIQTIETMIKNERPNRTENSLTETVPSSTTTITTTNTKRGENRDNERMRELLTMIEKSSLVGATRELVSIWKI